jgi:hypothetical protein
MTATSTGDQGGKTALYALVASLHPQGKPLVRFEGPGSIVPTV